MAAGVPLTDEDRWPWLRSIGAWMSAEIAAGRSAVVTCSALRRSYRDLLREGRPEVVFCHLTADPDLFGERVSHRTDHYMPASLLPSQLASARTARARRAGLRGLSRRRGGRRDRPRPRRAAGPALEYSTGGTRVPARIPGVSNACACVSSVHPALLLGVGAFAVAVVGTVDSSSAAEVDGPAYVTMNSEPGASVTDHLRGVHHARDAVFLAIAPETRSISVGCPRCG